MAKGNRKEKEKEKEKDLETPTEQKTVKVWKTSITKSELALLPAESYTGKITIVEDDISMEAAIKILAASKIIGFDTETKPSFKRGEHHNVSLLQLSTLSESFLIRLNKIGMPKGISDILENQDILKIGLSIHDDFMSLQKVFDINPQNFIDLQQFVKDYKIADNSLSRIYGILFDKRISKGQRLTNWEASELTIHQKEYAALDAYACLVIYNHLLQNGFDYKKSKYYRQFDEPSN